MCFAASRPLYFPKLSHQGIGRKIVTIMIMFSHVVPKPEKQDNTVSCEVQHPVVIDETCSLKPHNLKEKKTPLSNKTWIHPLYHDMLNIIVFEDLAYDPQEHFPLSQDLQYPLPKFSHPGLWPDCL